MSAVDRPANLYRHFAADGQLLYVGISLGVIARQREHMFSAAWRDTIVRIEICKYASRESAATAEREAIINEKPLHNITYNSIHNSQCGYTVAVRMEPSLKHAVVKLAKREGITATAIMRLAISQFLEEECQC